MRRAVISGRDRAEVAAKSERVDDNLSGREAHLTNGHQRQARAWFPALGRPFSITTTSTIFVLNDLTR